MMVTRAAVWGKLDLDGFIKLRTALVVKYKRLVERVKTSPTHSEGIADKVACLVRPKAHNHFKAVILAVLRKEAISQCQVNVISLRLSVEEVLLVNQPQLWCTPSQSISTKLARQ